MSNYRLNMQIGNLMQHVIFPDRDTALEALGILARAKVDGGKFTGFPDNNVIVDPQAVSFAEVRKQ